MAVGTMVTSTEELETNGWAMRGKGVRILHTFGDCLWGLGDRSEPPDGDVAHQEVDEGRVMTLGPCCRGIDNSD